ncbi:tetratricopeptide repeat protein [Actinomycetospora lutea]|uniref:tetratricopeptide repeat protein n=1 Tax=Actinomycetospora lutea TaxID=663604 RepID=UPI003B684F0D
MLPAPRPVTALLSSPLAAITQFRAVADARTWLFGAQSPRTLNARRNLGAALARAGHNHEAVELLTDVCATYRSVLGADHPYTATATATLQQAQKAK